jgi:hypothetical protein
MKKVVRGCGEMILSDWLTVVISIMALVVLYLDKKIPKRYGGYIIPTSSEKLEDHFSSLTDDGKPVPGKWHVRQARMDGLRRFLLWTMAVGGIVVCILRKLRW